MASSRMSAAFTTRRQEPPTHRRALGGHEAGLAAELSIANRHARTCRPPETKSKLPFYSILIYSPFSEIHVLLPAAYYSIQSSSHLLHLWCGGNKLQFKVQGRSRMRVIFQNQVAHAQQELNSPPQIVFVVRIPTRS